jgi:deoxyribonuclease V
VKINWLHDWNIDITAARALQVRLSRLVVRQGRITGPRFIAGIDLSVERWGNKGTAAVVVLEYPRLVPVEVKVVSGEVNFPYIPGLLSFREAPLILAACEQLDIVPDLFMVDGQGIAHPRRLGIAAHLGLFLDAPTIGCAKSPLWGQYKEPETAKGSYTEIMDKGEVIGAALRTKNAVKPVYISIGNKIDLDNAVYWVLECCRGYRLPEPTRLAHLAAGGNLPPVSSVTSYSSE